MSLLLVLSTLAVAVASVDSARILGVFPLGAKSHHWYLQTVAKTLAQAGHQVEVYSPFPWLVEGPNLTHYEFQGLKLIDKSKGMLPVFPEITTYPFYKCMDLLWPYMDDMYKGFKRSEDTKKILTSGKKYDLILTEIFNGQEFSLLLAHKLKVPVIGLQAYPTNSVLNVALGNPLSISYIPDICTSFSNKMSLYGRALNAFSVLRGLYLHYNYFYPKLEGMIREDFPDAPPLEDLTQRISLMFVNDHLTADYAQPRTPNIIPVGGIHIQPPRPLPENIKQFMDDATAGVIFFCLGTYVSDEQRPKEYIDMYLNVFKNIKQKVIWKTNRTLTAEEIPRNVMILEWAPQKDILAHPRCKLFVTHGGQHSLLEALYFGVPVISIPQFFDQHRNSEFYVRKGVGLKIPLDELSEKSFSKALHQVLESPSYGDNMKRLSAIFRDRPMSPAESVVYWTEYVLRHNGAAHLRPVSTELRWYQVLLLDIFSILFVSILTFVCLVYFLFQKYASMGSFSKQKTS